MTINILNKQIVYSRISNVFNISLLLFVDSIKKMRVITLTSSKKIMKKKK